MMGTPRKRNRRKANQAEPGMAVLQRLRAFLPGLRQALSVLASLGVIGALVWSLGMALDRPIAKVEVGGQFQRVALLQIEEVVAPFRGEGFLSVDLDALRAALETIDWVDRARVERKWPNGVRVRITEHVAAARWGDEGLMNTRGELFITQARYVPPELPQLIGPPGTESQVAQLYLKTYPRLLDVGMRLARVELDARGAWELTLANDVVVRLGRQDLEGRLERFIRVASPLVATRGGEVRYVDLRYSNGFSVGWNALTRVARDGEDVRPDV